MIHKVFWFLFILLFVTIGVVTMARQVNVYALVDNDQGPPYWQLIWGKAKR